MTPVPSSPPTAIACFATQAGGTTIDCDKEGGNPFASALIELASDATVGADTFPRCLAELTTEKSGGHQSPEWVGGPSDVEWRLLSRANDRSLRRTALVMVVHDYTAINASLDGAAYDELRVSSMFAGNGFSVTQAVGAKKHDLLDALAHFRTKSESADISIIYCTGHGREADGRVYLLPNDYPVAEGYPASILQEKAISVTSMMQACISPSLNLVFFAGCRAKEFAWP